MNHVAITLFGSEQEGFVGKELAAPPNRLSEIAPRRLPVGYDASAIIKRQARAYSPAVNRAKDLRHVGLAMVGVAAMARSYEATAVAYCFKYNKVLPRLTQARDGALPAARPS